MSRIKKMVGAVMVAGALLNVAPVATAAEAEVPEHCFIVDHPVVCFAICTAQNASVKECGVQAACGSPYPTVCEVVGIVWRLVP